MVKKYKGLWKQVIDENNIADAYRKAILGKKHYTSVKRFEQNKEANLKAIREMLVNQTYKTSPYHERTIYEPKERIIYVLSLNPDRVVHWALMNVLIPILTKMFIKNTFACIKDRGLHKGSILTSKFVKEYKYCLKCDIRKFYPSINHDILYQMCERKFKEKEILWLLHEIIYSIEGETNVPIGNLPSQWFGNFYLTPLDRYITEELHIKSYLRYCDDFCLFSNDKAELNKAKKLIEEFLRDKLKLKMSKCDLFKTSQGVDFLGYRHFNGYKLLRRSTAKRVKKRLPAILKKYKSGKMTQDRFRSCVESTYGWVKWANTYNFQLKLKLSEMRELAYIKENKTDDIKH